MGLAGSLRDSVWRTTANRRRLAVVVTSAVALLATSAAVAMTNVGAPEPSPASAVVIPISAASATDVAWAQLTIALNERALQVIDLVLERSANPRLRHLARELKSGLRTEIDQIRARLVALGAGLDNPHASHDMPGMATASTLSLLAAAFGPTFDELASDAIEAHLTQCRRLARSEQTVGTDLPMTELARRVDAERGRQLLTLTAPPTAKTAM